MRGKTKSEILEDHFGFMPDMGTRTAIVKNNKRDVYCYTCQMCSCVNVLLLLTYYWMYALYEFSQDLAKDR